MASTYEELLEIYKRRERLTPEIVVDEARPEDHPLHSRFEWDDTVAGELHRRTQAGELIRSCRVIYAPASATEPARSVRAIVSVPEPAGRSYFPIVELTDDEFRYQQVLNEFEAAWQALKRQYGHLKEFREITQRVDEAV